MITRRQSDNEIESQAWSMHVTMMHMLGGKEMFLVWIQMWSSNCWIITVWPCEHSFNRGADNLYNIMHQSVESCERSIRSPWPRLRNDNFVRLACSVDWSLGQIWYTTPRRQSSNTAHDSNYFQRRNGSYLEMQTACFSTKDFYSAELSISNVC